MPAVTLYFQVHQPHRLRRYSVFDSDPNYFDHEANTRILRKVAHKCYLPAARLLLDQMHRHNGAFRVAFSLTGEVIEQLQQDAPDVIDLFVEMARSGCVEFLAETYHHSLASLYNLDEFDEQVDRHTALIEGLFVQRPAVFRNTELIHSNKLAAHVASRGRFVGLLAEGADFLLNTAHGDRSPHHVYATPPGPDGAQLPVLLRDYRLSDDIAFRFGDTHRAGHPLTAAAYAEALAAATGDVVNLFMDFETFGEHQWQDTGIFDFLADLPGEVLARSLRFTTPQDAFDQFEPVGVVDAPQPMSWADQERDASAWVGNAMQTSALHDLYRLRDRVLAAAASGGGSDTNSGGDDTLLCDWRRLTTSDHFYYMSTKAFADGAVHQYFSPYESPYDGYINFMNVLDNLRERVEAAV